MDSYNNILDCKTKEEFYDWLKKNHETEKECWIECKKGKIKDKDTFYYIDAVYMALCFGWIDSVQKVKDGIRLQRFSKRCKNSNWSELNKARCKWLIEHKLMTDAGLKVLPDLDENFEIDGDILDTLQKDSKVWKNFNKFPELYKRVRIGNIQRDKKISNADYKKTLEHFLEETKNNKMYGDWDDGGRLKEVYE